jgi:hypothetical protein
MSGKALAIVSALSLAAIPAAAARQDPAGTPQEGVKQGVAKPGAPQTGGQSYGDRDRGGRSGFYSYPRHRHIDGSSGAGLDRPVSKLDSGTSPYCDNCHGSAYYGRDYGAPYFGGGYYDRGVYYRERRD